jgi:hypothetical protein
MFLNLSNVMFAILLRFWVLGFGFSLIIFFSQKPKTKNQKPKN